MAILPLFFQYRYTLFYFLLWLLSLGLPILYWTRWWEWASCLISDFNRNGFSFSLMSIMLAVSLSCRAFCCAMFPLFPLWWEFLSWIDVEFYLMIFLHLFRWSCGFCGVSCVSCDHVFHVIMCFCGVSCGVSHWLICMCWIILVTLGWIQLDRGYGSFYVLLDSVC